MRFTMIYELTKTIKKNYNYDSNPTIHLRAEIGFKQVCFQSRFKNMYIWC